MLDMILEVKNLHVELEGEKIIEDLSFTVQKGDIVAILGPNGAGKTVLLRTLLGFLPYRGEIIWRVPAQRFAYVPQRLSLIKDIPLTVIEFFRLKSSSVPVAKIKTALLSVGLEDSFLKKNISWLTPGQFQRALVAWQLISNPEVIFFDEPMEGIDAYGQQSIYQLLKKIHQERNLTIFLVSHDLSVVYQFASKVLCLSRNLVCAGMPKEELTAEMLTKLYGGEVKFYEHHHD